MSSTKITPNNSALVLFSGGQDSTVCLAWALNRFDHVETVGFNYGQRHNVELKCREKILKNILTLNENWSDKLHDDYLLDLPALGTISDTALTAETEISFSQTGLPNTFVPGRNLLFFTYAAAIAYRRDIGHLVGGMCETDFSGYPDCRSETLRALQKSIALGMEKNIQIDTPLMWLNKAETWELAKHFGGEDFVNLIIDDSHTCYVGDRETKHQWGYGCGECPACKLRANGYTSWRAKEVAISEQNEI